MKVLVLGAGVIGTASAWYLRRAGHEVRVLERQAGPARETSFANGGQISVSHAEPWANPAMLKKLIGWIGREDAPLLLRLRPELLQWRWCLQFIRECQPARVAANLRQIVALADYSRLCLQRLRADTGIEYDCLQRGILHFYTDPREFARSQKAAALMRELGCARNPVDAEQVLQIEPALAGMRGKIVGGDYTATDESGDVHAFSVALAHKAAAAGVTFSFNSAVTRLLVQDGVLRGVELIDADGCYRSVEADAVVVALGSFSAPLLKPLGIDLLIYPGKGYSASYPIIDAAAAPSVSLTDDGHKLVISRLGDQLRVAGTCELNGYERSLNPARCALLTRRARELFPSACNYQAPRYWAGLRPLTPSNVPYIGASRIKGVFLNTGHGTLGWTMACGAGQALADLVAGRTPAPAFNFTGPPIKSP